jgi:ubiquinone/menaquinone biosynthesis C-methylase UbiE
MGYDAPSAYVSLIAPRYVRIARVLVDAARLRATDEVLEVGAGTGLVTGLAAPHVRTLLATDAAPQMLEQARTALRRRKNVAYALVDYGAPLPFLDGSFSLVLSGLTYVQDSPAAVSEVARVLRPGGRLALSMWGARYQERLLLDAAIRSVGGGRFPSAAPGRALRRLEHAGFRSIRREDVSVSNTFATVDDYIAYRRGFGIPSVWSRAHYERFLRAVRREASRVAAADGSFELGWTFTVLTARAPAPPASGRARGRGSARRS